MTEVAVAVLWRDGKLLARRRREDEHLPGLWEFPGGKVRPGETPEAAARREVLEEMGVHAGRLSAREILEHAYPDRIVRIHVFEGACEGEPRAADGAAWVWLAPSELARRPVPDANASLVARLVREARGGTAPPRRGRFGGPMAKQWTRGAFWTATGCAYGIAIGWTAYCGVGGPLPEMVKGEPYLEKVIRGSVTALLLMSLTSLTAVTIRVISMVVDREERSAWNVATAMIAGLPICGWLMAVLLAILTFMKA